MKKEITTAESQERIFRNLVRDFARWDGLTLTELVRLANGRDVRKEV